MIDRLVGQGDTTRATRVGANRNGISRPIVGPGNKVGPDRGSAQHHQAEGGCEECRTSFAKEHVRGSFPIRSTVHESQNTAYIIHRSGIAGEKGVVGRLRETLFQPKANLLRVLFRPRSGDILIYLEKRVNPKMGGPRNQFVPPLSELGRIFLVIRPCGN